MTKKKDKRNKFDLIVKIVLIIIIIILLIHNCVLVNKNYNNKAPNGNIDIIDIKCDDNKCQPVITPTPGKVEPAKIVSIKFAQKNISIKAGDSLGLIPIIKPSELSSSKLTWKSSNPQIVTIDANGVIKGVSVGQAVITVTSSNGISATCVVNVTKETVKVETIKLNTDKMTLNVGDTSQIIATIEPENATDRELVWESSDSSIASADNKGIINGLKPGKVTITVKTKDGKVKATCEVEIKPIDVEEIKLDSNKKTIKVGSKTKIIATVIPGNATDKDLIWESSDPGIASVDNKGIIDGLKPGKVTITVKTKDGKVKAVCEVEIKPIDVEEITLDSNKKTINVGDKTRIIATVKPDDATDKELIWETSDPSIATVDKNGVVRGLKPGKVTITVKTKDGKVKATCEVEIKPIEVQEIELNPHNMSVKVGSTSQIVAVISPDNATDKELIWETSDSSVATVDSNGKVKGMQPGIATITAKTKDGKVKATCTVEVKTVTIEVTDINLNTNELSMQLGSTSQLIATIEPENATDRELIWESSDPSIATVDSTGKVTGVKIGTTTITVKTKDGKVKATCTVNVQAIPVEEIILNTNELSIKVKRTEQLIATIDPENATDKDIIWESSDPRIATVDNTGKVTGIKEGTVTITAKTKDGKVKATCTVNVSIDLIDEELNVFDDDHDPINWNGSSDLKIFSKSIYDFDDIIAPESSNTYEFVVRNNTKYKIKYSVKFIESNLYDINMKYKLKKNSDYIVDTYSNANALIIDEYTLDSNESDTYYLEWKWLSSNNDTDIGANPEAKYGLKIEVEAESINE